MIVIVGKTCSGKSTVADLLDEKYGIRRIRTYTTRPRREGEKGEYHFISGEEFDKLKHEGFFFETTQYSVADGSTWRYGTSKSSFCNDCCIIMNPAGVKNLKHMYNNSDINLTVVYLNVTDGVIWNRLRSRGDSSDEATRRIEADRKDFADIEEFYDYAITTDDLEPEAVATLISIIYLME